MHKCKYCNKTCKNNNSRAQHEIRCKNNPDRIKASYNLKEYHEKVKRGEIEKKLEYGIISVIFILTISTIVIMLF